MSTSRGKAGVRVRGTCAAGHTTETTSAPGRTTWEGECAQDGCELRVKARRVPVDRSPAAPAVSTPPKRSGDPYEVKEVRSYGRKRQPQPERQPKPEPEPEGGRSDVPPAGAGPVGDAGTERPARGGRRLTFARGGERAVTRREFRRPDFLEGIIGG